MKIGAYQKRKANDPQIRTFAFGMPPLGKDGIGLRIDERVEIGGIEEQRLQINLEVFNQSAGEIFFDFGDGGLIEVTHVIPETLT